MTSVTIRSHADDDGGDEYGFLNAEDDDADGMHPPADGIGDPGMTRVIPKLLSMTTVTMRCPQSPPCHRTRRPQSSPCHRKL
eukprot:7375066-Pyramimonas_sp.AAC.1